MSSLDNSRNTLKNNNAYKDEFLEYYQKHRPPGAVPNGYNFKPFCKMEVTTGSLSGSLYGEIGPGEGSQFSHYRQSDSQKHNLTLSPPTSTIEDDDSEHDKTGKKIRVISLELG